MKKAWKSYGVNVEISAPGLRKIILFGTRTGVAGKDWRGSYNIQRRTIQSHTSDKADDDRHDVIRPTKFFRPLWHHKIKVNDVCWLSYQRTCHEWWQWRLFWLYAKRLSFLWWCAEKFNKNFLLIYIINTNFF